MKAAICDNDTAFIGKLKNCIGDYFARSDLAGEFALFSSPVKLLEADLSAVDVVFLDVDMPEMDGIEAAGHLRRKYPDVLLVFVTDYIEYEPAGYRVDAFRYLLKSRISQELDSILDEIVDKLYIDRSTIQVKSQGDDILLPLKNIVYIEGTGRRMVLVHLHNKYSDYVANKTDAEAIVCRSVTGEDVFLTRADFESDEVFQRWKGWSDADYKQSERRDRAYNDRRLSLAAAYFLSDRELNECLSGELKAAEQQTRDDLVSHIRSLITDTQFSRLWRRFACGRELADIAAEDGVSVNAVADSIQRATKKLGALRYSARGRQIVKFL